MANSTGLQFTVKIGALADTTFAVVDFELSEALNQPFALSLSLASSQADIDFGAVLDQPCELMVWYEGALQRRVSGIVGRFAQGDTGFRRTRYQAEVRPALWRLGLRTNARIFQTQKPDEIITQLLQEAGISDFAFSLRHDHAVREYCVQYRESDLAFINRLAAEEGMFYFHEFEAGKHRVVFADDAGALAKGPELFFNLATQGLSEGAYVRRFRYAEAVSTAEVELKDYCFKTPAYGLSHKKTSNELEHQRESYQHFDYPGRFKQDPSGKAFTGHRLDALRADAITGVGESNAAELRPGSAFTLTEHPNPAFNLAWQVVAVTHSGQQPQALEEESGGEPTTLSNSFEVVKATTTWRAALPYKPMVDGPQIATVVGPAGEEIYCDKFGRVKLQFPWDRYGASDDQSSCWVRVSQGWAGGQYGLIAIPRIGHEVVVSFLEGDPDQPLITGRTFHATNPTPYVLPEHKTRTTLRTDTHKGSGFNELRFEDETTREQIYLHAQKDLDAVINNIHRQSVGLDQHLSVANDQFQRVDRHSHRTIGQDDFEQIGQDHHQSIDRHLVQSITQSFKRFIGGGEITRIEGSRQTTLSGSEETLIGAHQRVLVNTDSYLNAADIVLESGQSLTIKAPGGFIKIDGAGVTISGTVIINGKLAARIGDAIGCGGSVAAGSGDVIIGDTPYQSPVKSCAEQSAKSRTPLLALTPMLLPAMMEWAATAELPVLDEALTVLQRKDRYLARAKLAQQAATMPGLKDAATRLAFNNDSILRAEAAQYVYPVDEVARKARTILPKAPVGLVHLTAKEIPELAGAKFTDPDSGFGATLFKSDINGETMLTFRGTNNAVTGAKDWMTNLSQGMGKDTAQYKQAMYLAKQVKDILPADTVIVGHSLGGGLGSAGVGAI